jgi:hypothetical protein
VRIDFGGEIVNPGVLSVQVPGILQVEQRRCSDGFGCGYQDFLGRFVEVLNAGSAFADDFEMVMIVATIEGQIKASGARITEEVWVLVALIGNAFDKYLLFFQMNAVL